VVSVSHDAAQDEQLGLVFSRHGSSWSGPIDYLLSPLQQHTTESLRER
jgi:hypothetical protein